MYTLKCGPLRSRSARTPRKRNLRSGRKTPKREPRAPRNSGDKAASGRRAGATLTPVSPLPRPVFAPSLRSAPLSFARLALASLPADTLRLLIPPHPPHTPGQSPLSAPWASAQRGRGTPLAQPDGSSRIRGITDPQRRAPAPSAALRCSLSAGDARTPGLPLCPTPALLPSCRGPLTRGASTRKPGPWEGALCCLAPGRTPLTFFPSLPFQPPNPGVPHAPAKTEVVTSLPPFPLFSVPASLTPFPPPPWTTGPHPSCRGSS